MTSVIVLVWVLSGIACVITQAKATGMVLLSEFIILMLFGPVIFPIVLVLLSEELVLWKRKIKK